MELPRIEPVDGKHAGPRDIRRNAADAIETLASGHIQPGWGKRRAKPAMYAHLSYTVTESRAA